MSLFIKNIKKGFVPRSFLKSKNSGGFTMLIAIILVAFVLSTGLSLTSVVVKELSITSNLRESMKAFYAVESGFECARYWLLRETDFFTNPSQTYLEERDCYNEQYDLGGSYSYDIDFYGSQSESSKYVNFSHNPSNPREITLTIRGLNSDDNYYDNTVQRFREVDVLITPGSIENTDIVLVIDTSGSICRGDNNQGDSIGSADFFDCRDLYQSQYPDLDLSEETIPDNSSSSGYLDTGIPYKSGETSDYGIRDLQLTTIQDELDSMITAIQGFLDYFRDDSNQTVYKNNNKIGLVRFAGSAYAPLAPTDDAVAVDSHLVANINDQGRTNIASGLSKAYEIINENDPGDLRANIITLITDGTPTHYVDRGGDTDPDYLLNNIASLSFLDADDQSPVSPSQSPKDDTADIADILEQEFGIEINVMGIGIESSVDEDYLKDDIVSTSPKGVYVPVANPADLLNKLLDFAKGVSLRLLQIK